MQKNKKLLSIIICLGLLTTPLFAHAQSASDYKTTEYYAAGGNELLRAADAYALGYTGKGINVGICDMVINYATPELVAKTGSYAIDHFDTSSFDWRNFTHGTHVGGIIGASKDDNGMHGIAFDSNLLSESGASVYNKDGSFMQRNDLYDLYYTHPEVKLINNSWGNYSVDVYSTGLFTEDIQDIFTNPDAVGPRIGQIDFPYFASVSDHDKLLVFAAGNEGHSAPDIECFLPNVYPKAAFNLINVTAADNKSLTVSADGSISGDRPVAIFSNLAKYAEDYTVSAPGMIISSAAADYATRGSIDMNMSGTSMAAPYVTGVGVLVQQAYPYLNAKQIGDVILSTANNNITLPEYQIQYQQGKGYIKVSVFFSGAPTEKTNSELQILAKNYFKDYYNYTTEDGSFTRRFWNAFVDQSNIQTFYYADLQELWGQGLVDAAKAVKGPGALNARRLTASDINTDYTVQGTKTSQALYAIDTQGYNSIWSNDIKEIKAGLIAADSTETDLANRYRYYYTNWLTKDDPFDDTKMFTESYINNFNQKVEASGLKGLSVGLLKEGNGTLALTGANTYKGSTIVKGGAVALTGSVAGDAYTLANGTLTGTGTVQGNLTNSGTLVPGLTVDARNLFSTTAAGTQGAGNNSVATGTATVPQAGTLAVNGNFTSNGQLIIATNGTNSGKLVVGGSSTLTGTALNVVNGGTNPLVNHTYNYLTSQGGITGNVTTTDLSPYVSLSATVDGNNGYFTANEKKGLGQLSNLTPSEQSVGAALNKMAVQSVAANPNAATTAVLNSTLYQSEAVSRTFIKQIASESRAEFLNQSPMSALTNESIFSRMETVYWSGAMPVNAAQSLDANAPQMKTSIPVALDATNNVWFKLFRGFENYNYNDSLENKSFGGVVGYDHAINLTTRIGGLFSYGVTDYNTDNIEGKSYDWRIGVYGDHKNGDWDYQALATYGRNHYDLDRSVTWEGTKTNSDYKAKVWDGEVKAKYFIPSTQNKTWQVKPYGKLSYTHTAQDAYAETGSSTFKQSLNSTSNNSWRGELGVELNRNINNKTSWGGSIGYKRVLSGLNPELNGTFVGDTNGFSITSDNDRNYVTYSLNARGSLGGKWMGQAEFRGEASSNTHKEILSVTAKYSF